ncbi:MAG: dCMP deaminase family protein [Candidatus Pacearchaeota archaeon]
MRLEKDDYYLRIAQEVAKRSSCTRRKYGVIIVKNDAIVSTGYNGTARGSINCYEVRCIKDILNLQHGSAYDLCPAVHAEENAIINAARQGSSVYGGSLYIAGYEEKESKDIIVDAVPCQRCKRAIINAGIEKVIMRKINNIEVVLVESWIKEDKEEYLKNLEKFLRGGQ